MKQDGVSTATVNREASMMKGMLFRAVEWDMIDRNPLQGLKLFKEAEKRRVNLTPEKAGQLIAELSEPLADAAEFSIYSGLRKENVLSLRIEQIRFHDLTLTGEVELVVKGGKRELFPLSTQAVEVVRRAIGNRREGYVFINPKTENRYMSINRSFDKAVRKLGLTVNGTKFRWHDLRHLFCSWLLKEGVSIDIIRELAGHKDRSTTDRYSTIERIEAGKNLALIPKIECPDRLKTEAI